MISGYVIIAFTKEAGNTESSQPFLVALKIPQKITENKHFWWKQAIQTSGIVIAFVFQLAKETMEEGLRVDVLLSFFLSTRFFLPGDSERSDDQNNHPSLSISQRNGCRPWEILFVQTDSHREGSFHNAHASAPLGFCNTQSTIHTCRTSSASSQRHWQLPFQLWCWRHWEIPRALWDLQDRQTDRQELACVVCSSASLSKWIALFTEWIQLPPFSKRSVPPRKKGFINTQKVGKELSTTKFTHHDWMHLISSSL